MKRVEAEAKMEKMNSQPPSWFCPLINTMCNPKCVNFEAAFLCHPETETTGLFDVKAHQDGFYVDGFVCSNAMFMPAIPMMPKRCGE